ncbi:A-factor type gamma-butyrolactone 1'-reductase (1S-forming)-like [Branchiostoma floridae x Branchiostoma belcheri]
MAAGGTTRKCVALVTGGGSGIGRAAAVRFAELGYNCAVADRDWAGATETVNMLKTTGLAVQVDVGDSASVQAMIQTTVEHFGQIDCAFNNAGIEGTARAKIADYPEYQFDSVVNVNLKGVWLCMKYEIAQMLKQERIVSDPEKWAGKSDLCRFQGQRGSIVNTSSTAGLGLMPEFTPYCASKWAIIGLTKTVAAEYAKEGIRVNAVCPATTDTAMRDRFEAQWPDWQAKTDASYPAGRVAAPEEVAEAVTWLCSDACPFATGEYLKIAGGR